MSATGENAAADGRPVAPRSPADSGPQCPAPHSRRVLILTSSTGGGHDMQALAFQTWARLQPGWGLEVAVDRPLEQGHGLYRFGVELYNFIHRTAPWLHHVYYSFLELVPVVRATTPLGAPRFRAMLETVRPDLLLSVHDSLNHAFFEYARRVLGRQRIQCATYCMELGGGYGFSRHWVNPAADLFIGGTEETCAAAVDLGMPKDRVALGGFLLRPAFYAPPLEEAARRAFLREKLQLDPQAFTLLMTASGLGANHHLTFLEAIQPWHREVQVIALCGRSIATAERIEAWARDHPQWRIRVLPADADLGLLMRSASALLARASGTVVSEAIVSGCPLLLNALGGLMPQEMITAQYCRRHGLAETVRQPRDLVHWIRRWLDEPGQRQAIRQRMQATRPSAQPGDLLRLVAALGRPLP